MPVYIIRRLTKRPLLRSVQAISRKLLDEIIVREDIALENKIPLKVHFGEHKNVTFIKPENYLGIIDYLEERDIESCYIETNVLYGGRRFKKELHEKTAEAHFYTDTNRICRWGARPSPTRKKSV